MKKEIHLFDIDDTLVRTKAKIRTVCPLGKTRAYTSEEFAFAYVPESHSVDYSDFYSKDLLFDGKIITKNFYKLIKADTLGHDIGVITSRPYKTHIREFLLHYGVSVKLDLIFAVNHRGSDPSKPNHIKKKDSVLHLIRNGYNHFYYYDDDHKNLKAVKSLEEEFKHVKINIFEC